MLESNLTRVIEHIGAELGAKRMEYGLSLNEVAQRLHIQHNYLDAIERLDKENLPTLGYALGYVRSYARYLGINENNAIERFKIDIKAPRNLSAPTTPNFIPKKSIRLPEGSLAIGIVLSCVFGIISWYGIKADNFTAITAVAATTQPSEDLQITQELPTLNNENIISLKAVGPSWVQVKDGLGNVLISRIMLKGEIFETERKNSPVLSLRDAGAIELYMGGKRVGAIGQRGESAKNIPLIEVAKY